MRRTTPLTAAAMLGLALLAPTTSAGAAGETCRGEAATIVGDRGHGDRHGGPRRRRDQPQRSGQDARWRRPGLHHRPDARKGASTASASTPAPATTSSTAPRPTRGRADVTLGAGADRFEGGAAGDDVLAGSVVVNGSTVTYPDTDTDVLVGGGGGDSLRAARPDPPTATCCRAGTATTASASPVRWPTAR